MAPLHIPCRPLCSGQEHIYGDLCTHTLWFLYTFLHTVNKLVDIEWTRHHHTFFVVHLVVAQKQIYGALSTHTLWLLYRFLHTVTNLVDIEWTRHQQTFFVVLSVLAQEKIYGVLCTHTFRLIHMPTHSEQTCCHWVDTAPSHNPWYSLSSGPRTDIWSPVYTHTLWLLHTFLHSVNKLVDTEWIRHHSSGKVRPEDKITSLYRGRDWLCLANRISMLIIFIRFSGGNWCSVFIVGPTNF